MGAYIANTMRVSPMGNSYFEWALRQLCVFVRDTPSIEKNPRNQITIPKEIKKNSLIFLKAVIVQRNHPKRNFLKIQATIKKDAKIFQYLQI